MLLTNGARQLADDLVAVDAETREILPVPLSTSVKAGSWAALPDTWRELVAQPPLILPRSDTRFVQLKAAYRAGGPSLLPTAVVFPVYETDAEPTIIRLRPLELLAGLGHTGSFFPEDDATLQSFLSWAEQTPAYVLNYGDGELALELLFDTLHRARPLAAFHTT